MTTERTKEIVLSNTRQIGDEIYSVLEWVTGSRGDTDEDDKRFVNGVNQLLSYIPRSGAANLSKDIAADIQQEGQSLRDLAKLISQGLNQINLALNPNWPYKEIRELWDKLS